MQIKRLPYPLYGKDSPDYYGTFFDCDAETFDESLHIVFKGQFKLEDPDMKKYLDEDLASFGLLIECPATKYRELRFSPQYFEERLIKANLTNIVKITPVIVAKSEIRNFHHSQLVEDFKSVNITIPEGGLMAFDDEYEIIISRNTPESVGSICRFRKSDVKELYDFDEDAINIYLSDEVYDLYKKFDKTEKTIFTSIYFPPVLADIIQNEFIDDNSGEHSNHRWYTAIENAILNRGLDVGSKGALTTAISLIGELMEEGAQYIDDIRGDKE